MIVVPVAVVAEENLLSPAPSKVGILVAAAESELSLFVEVLVGRVAAVMVEDVVFNLVPQEARNDEAVGSNVDVVAVVEFLAESAGPQKASTAFEVLLVAAAVFEINPVDDEDVPQKESVLVLVFPPGAVFGAAEVLLFNTDVEKKDAIFVSDAALLMRLPRPAPADLLLLLALTVKVPPARSDPVEGLRADEEEETPNPIELPDVVVVVVAPTPLTILLLGFAVVGVSCCFARAATSSSFAEVIGLDAVMGLL